MVTLVVGLIILVLLLVYGVTCYNRLIAMIEAARNNTKQIDIQLDRRYKVFESLIAIVRKSMDYEKSTLKEVVALRNQATQAKQAGDTPGQMQAENKISEIVGGLNVVFEQYPDLKANQNALQLQEEVVSTENKLSYAKQAFNAAVERYNAYKRTIPVLWIVATCPKNLDVDFAYWQLSQDQLRSHEDYTVKL